MRRLLEKSWKHVLFIVLVFSFVGLGAAATNTAAGTKAKKEGKTAHSEKHRLQRKAKKAKHKTQAEIKGDKTAAAASEQTNEIAESQAEAAESSAEAAEETAEADE